MMVYPVKMWTKYSHLSYNEFVDHLTEKLDSHELAYLRQLEEAVDFYEEFKDSDPEALAEEIDRLHGEIEERDHDLEILEDRVAELKDQLNTITETKDY